MREAATVGRRTLSLVVAALTLAPGVVLAQTDEPAPTRVVDAFEVPGDAAGADVIHAWQVSDGDAQWSLGIRGPEGESLGLALLEADGSPIDAVRGVDFAALYDLALIPGSYRAVVARSGRETLPFTLTARPQDRAFDPEPNDDSASAVDLVEGSPQRARLARSDGDRDRFAIDVPTGDRQLRDVVLESTGGPSRRLCLLDADDQPRVCRTGDGAVALHDLGLEPGRHVLDVSGSHDSEAGYTIRMDVIGDRRADREMEPNDDPATASAFDVSLGVSGRSSGADPDFFRATIEGELQLWEVVASGADIDYLTWVRPDGTELMRARAGPDGNAAITDLFLVPGSHLFGVRANGDYAISATPLGPPDPDGEREPNSDPIRAQPLGIGERRTGRLATPEDQDFYRFTVAAPERLALRLEQPSDAHFDLTLRTGDHEVLRERSREPGDIIDVDLWLEPGDYLLRLAPRQVSEGAYGLTTERLDPFLSPADQEPNDSPAFARAVPGSLTWTGTSRGGTSDHDWFELPPLTAPAAVVIRMNVERPWVKLYGAPDTRAAIELRQEDDGSFVAEAPPVDVPLYLELYSDGPYAVRAESAGWAPTAEAADPDVEMQVALETHTVAAYWPEAQRVDGTLSLSNTSSASVDIVVEARTSHFAWQAVLPEERISLAAGTTVEIPLIVRIGPDAWADEPVRISLAARAPDGGLRTVAVMMDASPREPAVGTSTGWTVPEALLGGLNVASLALGGVPRGDLDADREKELFDGVTPPGAGFGRAFEPLPAELVVDLAGEDPVPVAGTIINPMARAGSLRETPRRFELLLSVDGQTWASALSGEVTPLRVDQSFVLPEPMPATHAMLRVHSLHGDRGSFLSLGEWKVIATPGSVPDAMPANIADPMRGGHVVRRTPFRNDFGFQAEMLDGEPRRAIAGIGELDERFETVIGFQDGRAAQITELRWQDPDGSDEATRMERLEVHVGSASPLGPWESVGTWTLERGVDGSVPAFSLAEPTWARYVRLTSPFPDGARQLEVPARIEVLERVPDDEYRSILGEWGYASRLGPFEWLHPSIVTEGVSGPDAGDSREAATLLGSGIAVTDRVEIGEDVDWYRVEVPPGHNTLEIDVTGVPTVGVRLSLFDASGEPAAMTVTSRPDGSQRHVAVVDSGASYALLVEQPPFNAVFTFDTSGSMGPFLDFVMEGVREFAADVQPGREVAMIVPFDQPPLLREWQDQPFVLMAAVNGFRPADDPSSAAEEGLIASTALLREREGTRAILVVTDAETSSLDRTQDLWSALEQVRPIIHSVHVGASNQPGQTRRLMQSWAAAAGGEYAFPTTHAEMDRAFERMSTRLRRPVLYTLTAATSLVDRSPGSLTVVAPPGAPAALAPGVGVEIILDTSGSMRRGIDGQRRIAVAKASLRKLVTDGLAEGVPVALRTFGAPGRGKAANCGTTLDLPLQPLDRDKALDLIRELRARPRTSTPIAAALARVGEDLAEVTGSRTVVLVTDGNETCDGDPEAIIAELRAAGVDVNLNIVGFALDDEAVKEQMAAWAAAGGGTYFDASGAEQLADAILTAVSAPFRVYALDGDALPVARGTVGGEPVTLEPGSYRVEVLTEPPVTFEPVELPGGRSLSLSLAEEAPGRGGSTAP